MQMSSDRQIQLCLCLYRNSKCQQLILLTGYSTFNAIITAASAAAATSAQLLLLLSKLTLRDCVGGMWLFTYNNVWHANHKIM